MRAPLKSKTSKRLVIDFAKKKKNQQKKRHTDQYIYLYLSQVLYTSKLHAARYNKQENIF